MIYMKYFKVLLVLFILLIPSTVLADSCCSEHGGLDYCVTEGYWVCKDGTESKNCACSGTYYPNKHTQPTGQAPIQKKEMHNNSIIALFAVIALVLGLAISIIKATIQIKKEKE